MLWPGIAEELLATKAYFVRDGLFDDVDANTTHVGRDPNTSWGRPQQRHGIRGIHLRRAALPMALAPRGQDAARWMR